MSQKYLSQKHFFFLNLNITSPKDLIILEFIKLLSPREKVSLSEEDNINSVIVDPDLGKPMINIGFNL